MSAFSAEQLGMLEEQGLTEMRVLGETRFLGVPFEGELPNGTVYVWSGVRWFQKKEKTWR